MSSLIEPSTASSITSLPALYTNRQQVERVLAELPAMPARAESAGRDQGMGRAALIAPVRQVNDVLRPYGVQFDLSEDGGRTVIHVVDTATGEIIREIPPEQALTAADNLGELKGRLLVFEA